MVGQKYPSLNIVLANPLAPKYCPTIPSCNSKKTYATSSFPKHFNNDVDIPLLYKVPQNKVYPLALIFTRVASDGLDGRHLVPM